MPVRGTRALVLFSSLALFASACNDAIVSSDGAPRRGFDGTQMERPVFRSADDMMAVVEKRHGLGAAELARLEQEQKYQSLRSYLDESASATEEATGNDDIAYRNDGVLRDDFALGDGILSVLNRRGEIQIGDSVYKLTRDNVYAVLPENLALLNELVPTLSSPAPEKEDDRISVTALETEITEKEHGDGTAAARALAPAGPSFFTFNFSATASCTWQNGDRRMKGKAYVTNALFYAEAGVKTDWEKKKWYGWVNANAPGTLYVGHQSTLTKGGNTVSSSGSWSWPNASSVGIVITSGGFVTIRGTINSSHGSPIGWCYN